MGRKAITFEFLNELFQKIKHRITENYKGIKFALLPCPFCKKKWHKSYLHTESIYADFFHFKCPKCTTKYFELYPKSKQHRRGWKLRMKIHTE